MRSAALQGCAAAVGRPKGLRYLRPPLTSTRRLTVCATVLLFLFHAQLADAYVKFGVRVGGRQVTLKWAQLPVRYYITDRFVARADYSLYTANVSDQRSTEYRAWTLGVSFFF